MRLEWLLEDDYGRIFANKYFSKKYFAHGLFDDEEEATWWKKWLFKNQGLNPIDKLKATKILKFQNNYKKFLIKFRLFWYVLERPLDTRDTPVTNRCDTRATLYQPHSYHISIKYLIYKY